MTQVAPQAARHGRGDQGVRPSSSYETPSPFPMQPQQARKPLRGRHATGYDQGFSPGSGKVIYSSFHQEPGINVQQERVLQLLVFQLWHDATLVGQSLPAGATRRCPALV